MKGFRTGKPQQLPDQLPAPRVEGRGEEVPHTHRGTGAQHNQTHNAPARQRLPPPTATTSLTSGQRPETTRPHTIGAPDRTSTCVDTSKPVATGIPGQVGSGPPGHRLFLHLSPPRKPLTSAMGRMSNKQGCQPLRVVTLIAAMSPLLVSRRWRNRSQEQQHALPLRRPTRVASARWGR